MLKTKQFNTRNHYFSNRIIKALDQILDYPLTIIEAPMGYGKTTATSDYLSKASINMLWQKVYESGSASFLNGFAKLFCDFDNERAQKLIQRGFPDDVVSIQEAIQLIEDIQLLGKMVLVIDDYHLLDNWTINKFNELIVESKIDNQIRKDGLVHYT